MIQLNEILLKRNEEWLHFANPVRVISTARADEVLSALREAENAVFAENLFAAGFLSYESAPAFDRALRVLPTQDFPLLWFGLYREPKPISLPAPGESFIPLNWQATIEREDYNRGIEIIKDRIANGKTYQVNYTMRLRADFHAQAWNFFLQLAQSQNVYAAFVNTGKYVIASASPELFFELDGEVISSRPMKGTVKRGRTTAEDEEQSKWLHSSVKNRAENVMIVDMIRNDIGRVAEIGSVHVPELFAIEKYPTLFQMTSTVRAKTKASVAEIFSALFPCASITGAPKVSTMNVIAELETTPRKIYTGSIGYLSPERKAQFNVAIRTALIDAETHQAEYGVGGGIVWDSDDADEYREALLKSRVLTEQPREFSLIETMVWTPDEGYFLLERHLARLFDSAGYFGFVFSMEEITSTIQKSAWASPQKVRVLLNRAGELTIEAKDFQLNPYSLVVGLAKSAVHSDDVFLFHKTTRRDVYESALQACPGCDDVLLFNERDELTEFTIGNLVVEMDGELVTPPVSCGLLAGTFRAQLLATNQIRERVIMKDELGKCAHVYLANSVRRWVAVKFEGQRVGNGE